MSERLDRHDLKEDALMKQTAALAEFSTKHARILAGAGVLLLVVVIGVLVVRASARRAEEEAADMLTHALVEVNTGNLAGASHRLETMLETSAGTTSGRSAILLLADIRYSESKFPEAETLYRQGLDVFGKNSLEGQAAAQGLASCLENQSKNAEAAAMFRDLAAAASTPPAKADLLMAAARNFLKAGNATEATTLYRTVADDETLPRTMTQEAEIRLAQIQAPAAG